MGSFSWIHWVIVIGVIALLFGGRGKLSGLMGDAAKGIRAFREGLKGDDAPTATAPPPAEPQPLPTPQAAPNEPIVR